MPLMVLALLLVPRLDVPSWIQRDAHLARHELVKVESHGGGCSGEYLRTIGEDGLVTTWCIDRPAVPPIPPFRLSKAQLKELKDLIAKTNFDRLDSGPRADVDPEAVDGVDELYVVRKGKKVCWWSNAVFKPIDEGSPLFQYIDGLKDDGSDVLINVSKVSTWGYAVSDTLF